MKRKFLSILLTLAMALTLLPAAMADETPSEGGGSAPVEAPVETKVAQIGDKQYATLAEAVAAVADGGTVMLLADVTELETISITDGKKVDLNLLARICKTINCEIGDIIEYIPPTIDEK